MPSQPEENAPPTFEQAIESLESIVHELEDGQTGLAESLARYEQGVKLLKQCYELLQKAERRIELLTGVNAAGEPVTAPFEDSPSAGAAAGETATSATRSRKRSAKATPNLNPEEPNEIDVPRSLF